MNIKDGTQYKFLYQPAKKEISEFNDLKIFEKILLFSKEIHKHIDITK